MDWFEQLPEQCPPNDAKVCDGKYYRIVNGNPAVSSDFFSQRKLAPQKIFRGNGIDECIIRAVSLFGDAEDAKKRMKLPKFKHSILAEVILLPEDGMMKRTFADSHYSWWRTKQFSLTQVKAIEV